MLVIHVWCQSNHQRHKIKKEQNHVSWIKYENCFDQRWKWENENQVVKHYIFQLPKDFKTQIVNLSITIHVQTIPYNSCEKQMGDWYTQKYD